MHLTAIILTLNEEKHITDCIKSLDWADHILVFDSFSQDKTISLARANSAETSAHTFSNYAQQRNAALDHLHATRNTDWVFFVDADERATPEVATEIRHVIQHRPETGWYIPRHNYIFGKLTKGAGWFPDYQQRLFKFGHVRYERPVHEVAIVDGDSGYLDNPLTHYNYDDIAHFHAVQRKYTATEASILKEQGVKPKAYTPYTQALRHFWWRFFTLKGYRVGLHGAHLSALMSYYEMQKYQQVNQPHRN